MALEAYSNGPRGRGSGAQHAGRHESCNDSVLKKTQSAAKTSWAVPSTEKGAKRERESKQEGGARQRRRVNHSLPTGERELTYRQCVNHSVPIGENLSIGDTLV